MIEALAMLLLGQIYVNGQVEGRLWRTENVVGECECMHIGGMTAVVNVKDAWVNTKNPNETSPSIEVGARFDQPIIDGTQRKNYWFPALRGEVTPDHPADVQVIVEASVLLEGLGDDNDKEHRVVRQAIVHMDGDRPIAMSVTQTWWTKEDGWRDISFQAEFDEDSERTGEWHEDWKRP